MLGSPFLLGDYLVGCNYVRFTMTRTNQAFMPANNAMMAIRAISCDSRTAIANAIMLLCWSLMPAVTGVMAVMAASARWMSLDL